MNYTYIYYNNLIKYKYKYISWWQQKDHVNLAH